MKFEILLKYVPVRTIVVCGLDLLFENISETTGTWPSEEVTDPVCKLLSFEGSSSYYHILYELCFMSVFLLCMIPYNFMDVYNLCISFLLLILFLNSIITWIFLPQKLYTDELHVNTTLTDLLYNWSRSKDWSDQNRLSQTNYSGQHDIFR